MIDRRIHCSEFGRLAALLVLIFIAGTGAAGCAAASAMQPAAVQASHDEAALKTWEEGLRAFKEKDYSRAAMLFEVLAERSGDEELSRRALYGQAVARLIMARTPEEFKGAEALWESWGKRAPADLGSEDPRMLSPLLENLTPPGTPEVVSPKVEKPPKPVVINGGANKGALEMKEKEIERIKTRLDAKEKEVRRLRQQIDSLEKIHLKYQEKKQGVSSP